jgi:hypothetical protein
MATRKRAGGRVGAYEGVSRRRPATTRRDEIPASFEDALRDLWDNVPRGKTRVRVLDIEIHGSNPIDMFRVIGTDA